MTPHTHTVLNFLFTMMLTALSGTLHADPLYIRKITGMNGLTNGDVMSMTQDKRGLLWMATEEGLNSYDGYAYRHFYKPETPEVGGIGGNELSFVLDDEREPILWIGTQRSGLTAYNYSSHTFRNYRPSASDPKSLCSNGMTHLTPASDGGLWVCTFSRGIDLLDARHETFTHFTTTTVRGLKSDRAWTAVDDRHGHLYVGHVGNETGGLSVINIKERTAVTYSPSPSGLPNGEVRAICLASDGYAYLGTDRGVVRFDPLSRVFTTIPVKAGVAQPRVFDIKEVKDGVLWVATDQQGIMQLSASGHNSSHMPLLSPLQLLSGDGSAATFDRQSVRCIYNDRHRNVWLGLWANGVHLINQSPVNFAYKPFQTVKPTANDITWQSVGSVISDSSGNLWVGTDGGGINRFAGSMRTAVYSMQTGQLANNSVQAVLRDSHGLLWWGMYDGGAMRQDPATGRMQPVGGAALRGADVRAFYEHPSLGMLVATSRHVYVLSMETGEVRQNIKIGRGRTRALTADRMGRIYIGCYDDGIHVLSAQGRQLSHYHIDNSDLRSNIVNALHTDRQGNVWAGTNDGLVHLNPQNGRMTVYQRMQGLSNTHIRAIEEDGSGRIWVATNKGLSCLHQGHIYNFSEADGLRSGYFMDRASTVASDGTMYFGSVSGLCTFRPDHVMRQQPTPSPSINGIEILGAGDSIVSHVSYRQLSDISTAYDQNTIVVGFNIPNLAETKAFTYAYRIVGLDGQWHDILTPGSVCIRNLPPGNYDIEIRATQHNDVQLAQTASFRLCVRPPFWRSWWAYLIYIAVAGGIMGYGLWLYQRRLKAESLMRIEEMQRLQEQNLNQERLRFFTNITHELRTPLTLILGPLDDIEANATVPAPIQQKLAIINDNAKRLLQLVNQLLEFRKTETQNRKLVLAQGNMGQLVAECAMRFQQLNQNTDVAIKVDADTHNTTFAFDREVVITILNNLVSNALKYTLRGEILIACKRVGQAHVCLTVSDTGYGISQEAQSHIFERYYQAEGPHQASGTGIGLALCKSLADLHGAQLNVESAEGMGSTFTLTLSCHTAMVAEEPRTVSASTSTDVVAQPEAPSADMRLVLIVEDNADIRQYVAASFADDYNVLTAKDGEEGLLLATDRVPDIVISDIMMPRMNGIELCRKLKNDLRTSHIPVILLTAKDAIDDKEEGYESGADSYITKPFSAKLLRSRVRNLMEQRRHLLSMVAQQTVSSTSPQVTPDHEPSASSDQELTQKQEGPTLSALDQRFLDELHDLIRQNINSEDLNINFLCSHFCMSQSSFYRKVKAVTGHSGNVVIRKIRLQHAIDLMQRQGYNVSEAAYACGFNDVAYFRQCFKEEFGVAPTEYKVNG